MFYHTHTLDRLYGTNILCGAVWILCLLAPPSSHSTRRDILSPKSGGEVMRGVKRIRVEDQQEQRMQEEAHKIQEERAVHEQKIQEERTVHEQSMREERAVHEQRIPTKVEQTNSAASTSLCSTVPFD
jgi:hypothetical protein